MNRLVKRTTVLVVSILVAFLFSAQVAFAADVTVSKTFDSSVQVGDEVDMGYAKVTNFVRVANDSTKGYYLQFYLHFSDTYGFFGKEVDLEGFSCIDWSLPAPGGGGVAGPSGDTYLGYDYNSTVHAYGTVTGVDEENCTVTYLVTTYTVISGHEEVAWTGYQRLQKTVTIAYTSPTGSVQLIKQTASAMTDLVADNSLYSLEGAEYGLYKTEADAQADTNRVATFVTGSDGKTQTVTGIATGAYYVKEVKASPGYELDTQIVSVAVASGSNTFTVTEIPKSDTLTIYKVDSESNTSVAQGAATLAGAQFEITFYAGGYYTQAACANMTATRAWVVRTDENGTAALATAYLVSGDSFYYDKSGNATLPFGTVTIKEIAAPEGYTIPANAPTVVAHISENGVTYTNGATSAVFADEVITGTITVTKTLKNAGGADADPSVLAGVQITIVSQTTGKAVDTLTLDETGTATSSALPYDTYLLYEVPETLPEGVQPYAWTQAGSTENIAFATVNITASGNYGANFTDYTDTTVEVFKTDIDTGEPLADAEFTLYTVPSEYLVISEGNVTVSSDFDASDMDAWEPVGALTTGEDGVASFEDIIFGAYRLIETAPPENYLDETATQKAVETIVHDFVVDMAHSGAQIPVEDKHVSIAIEIYEYTIEVTSALLDATEYELTSNVGSEEIIYHVGTRNLSSVDTDPYTLTTLMDELNEQGLFVTRVWTGTATGDADGVAVLQYRTNLSDGWLDWAEISVLEPSGFDVAGLGLAEGEYITGLQVQFGAVTADFHSGIEYGDEYDWCFAVVGTQAMTPDDGVLVNSSRAYTARMVTATTTIDAEAVDSTETTVIDSFTLGEAQEWTLSSEVTTSVIIPATADSAGRGLGFALAVLFAAGAVSVSVGGVRRRYRGAECGETRR